MGNARSFFNKLDKEFDFDIDLAANIDNTKCKKFFTEKDGALTQDWIGTCWLNPPYGGRGRNSLKNWIKKSYNEAKKHKSTVVVLTPARTNTKWWHNYCMQAREIKFVLGRPKFKGAKYGLPQPLAIVVFSIHSSNFPKVTTFKFK